MRARIRKKRMIRRIVIMLLAVAAAFGIYAARASPGRTAVTPPQETPEATPAPTATPEPTASPSAAPELPHIHHWTSIYEVEHEDAQGHYETVTVEAAWDEPQYGTGFVCSVCGAGFGDAGSAAGHIGSAHGYEGSYYQSTIQTGSIHHDAVTEQRWVTDKPENNESIESGWICAECGETREYLPGLNPRPR